MDKLLDYYNIPKLIKEEVENLNSPITIIETFPQDLDICMAEFFQSFMK